MSDGKPTSTDPMEALEDVKRGLGALRGDVFTLRDEHGRRIGELERQRREDRELVIRLHERIAEMSGAVALVLQTLEGQEKLTRDAFAIAVRELSTQMTAAVRGEMAGFRGDVQALRKDIEALPCLVGRGAVEEGDHA